MKEGNTLHPYNYGHASDAYQQFLGGEEHVQKSGSEE